MEPGRAKDTKQTQLRRRQGEGQVLCGKGIMTNQTGEEHGKNKANWHRSFKFEGCRGRPPCLPIRRAATGSRPYTRAKAVRTNEANLGRQAGAMHLEDDGLPYSIEPSSREALGDATQTASFLGAQRGNLAARIGRAFATHRRDGSLTWRGTGC
jgi:hypothetical protein